AQEPDTATVSCFCTADLNPNFKATAKDTASFDCQTPGLTVTKDCALRDTNGNSAVTITVTNTGSAALANCKVTDTNLTGETCTTPPGLPAAEISVAVSPNMFDLGVGAPAVTAAGTIMAAEALTVQYVAQNTGGTALFSCTVTDSNTAISSTGVNIGDVASGGTSTPVPINKTCSDTLDAQEADTATLSCFCTADLNPNF